MNSVKWPCSLWVFIDHWIGCLPSVQEVMGLIPFGDSDFFLSHARAMLISSLISFQNHNTPLSSFMSVFELKSNLSQTLANPITKDKDNPELRVIRCSWCRVPENLWASCNWFWFHFLLDEKWCRFLKKPIVEHSMWCKTDYLETVIH